VKPRLLDLYCGAGGCSVGYHRAGFDVVGVDLHPQPNYPYEFHQFDAISLLSGINRSAFRPFPPINVRRFDAIHASPPCQAYTTMNNRRASSSPPLIAQTRALVDQAGMPYVIENVLGARSELNSPILLTGEMFGLRVHRPRLFEANWPLMSGQPPPRQHNPVPVYGKLDGRRVWTRSDGTELRAPRTLEPAAEAMGIDWMTWDELREAIPPAMTEYIGHQLVQYLAHLAVGRVP
jgi:DNA (cytosine-5)-methyltransferase 1